MEKGIEVIARYHYQQGYFVEVTTERSVLAAEIIGYVRKTVHEKCSCSAVNLKMKIRKCIRSLTRSKTMLKNMNIQICS